VLLIESEKHMREDLKQYQVEPDVFWQITWVYGDGYNVIERAEARGWRVIAAWGKAGYDLGSWPLVIVFHRNMPNAYELVEYCEGDVTMYKCPTCEVRNAITDEIAFFHWKHKSEPWVEDYETVEQLPNELRGPYRR
jgi:hypothetical protein